MTSLAETLVIKDGNVFMLALRDGRVPADGDHPLGLWLNDCRFLSALEVRVGGTLPQLLTGTAADGTAAVHELTADSVGLRIERRVEAGGALRQTISVRSRLGERLHVPIEVRLGTDFLPMLELRGLVPRHDRPAPRGWPRAFELVGRDAVRRTTTIRAEPAPRYDGPGVLAFDLELEPRGRIELTLDLEISEHAEGERATAIPARPSTERTRVTSDDELFNRILHRSLADLELLRSHIGGRSYYAAGLPWFATLFGRDSLITAFETLAFTPRVAEGTLRLLAARLGTELNDDRDEEPGKVVHELRVGEPAALGETPFARYYGSADATPLFLCLLGHHAEWSGTLDLFRELREPAEAALAWIDRYGDLDGDGLVEYRRRAERGLETQGWKDSPGGSPDASGEPLAPPVALVEVQGYVARAKRLMARMFELDGDGARGDRLREEAERVEAALDRFWLEEEGRYALGLDADKRRGAGAASNQGHLLWAGAVSTERAARIRDALISADMFTGWGVRTLGESHPAYDPLGYHTGSVWPHDSSLIAAGLRRYGFDEDFGRIFEGLLEAASRLDDYRLPELFGGFARDGAGAPVPYPVACRPQAWAAGAIPFLLACGLGLSPDALGRRLRVSRPWLPRWVSRVEVTGLEVGSSRVDLRFERSGDRGVLADARVDGDLEVV